MKSYRFLVVIEPDEDGWHIYAPELRSMGASTWGRTQREAFYNIREVLEMIIEEFVEEGKAIPNGVVGAVSEDLAVTVTV